jgi:serine/threonine protein kinase
LETLGEGAFGRVTRAELKDTGTIVAVKHFLHNTANNNNNNNSNNAAFATTSSQLASLRANGEDVSMNWASYSSFQYEAELASNLDNKYLVRQLGIDIKELALVLEYAPHGVLGNLLYQRNGASSSSQTNSSTDTDSMTSFPRAGLTPLSLQLRKKFCRDIALVCRL